MTKRRLLRAYRTFGFPSAGLDSRGQPFWNLTDGTQVSLEADSSGVPTVRTVTNAGAEGEVALPTFSGGTYYYTGNINATGDLTVDDITADDIVADTLTLADALSAGDASFDTVATTGNVSVGGSMSVANGITGSLLVADDVLADTMVLSAVSGDGIKLNKGSPAYGWRDLEGLIYPDATAGAVRGQFITGCYAFAYTNSKTLDFSFHIPHDWVPGSDLYIHVHWGHNADTTATGNVVFNFSITYAKGHNQANFPAVVSPSITYALTNLATTPRYRHRIDEIQLSASSPSATQLDTDDIEPDGLIQGTCTVDLSGATLTTTSPVNAIYIFTLDLHYQSRNVGTLYRNVDTGSFYADDSFSATGALLAGRSAITATGKHGIKATGAMAAGAASITGSGTKT